MKNKLAKQELEFLASLDSGKTQEELFDEIADYIRRKSVKEMSIAESRTAARNLINFYETLYESLRAQIREKKENKKMVKPWMLKYWKQQKSY